jgi:sulfur-carrier protein
VASVTVRFFAAARAASGAGERLLTVSDPATIASALDAARTAVPDADRAGFDAVMARCSFLVNEIATGDRENPLRDGDLIDVLPPFAGG